MGKLIRTIMARSVLCLALLSAVTASVVIPTQQIAPGVSIPVISMGTWSEGTSENSTLITHNWLSQGGRGIDTAWVYFDQTKIAETILASGVPREQLFITSKIPGCVAAERFVEADLKQLNTSYIDLMLIHSAIPSLNCPNTWKVLEEYVQKGKLRAIGVSNFKSKDLDGVLAKATIVPAVNQISHSVFEHDDELVQYCAQKNITIEAYSPLGSPGRVGHRKTNATSVFKNPTISSIAQAHNVSNPQVALRWIVQGGHILTVLSESTVHQANDADIFNFQLSANEMKQLSDVQKSTSSSFDPACSGYPTAVICASDPSCTWNGSECDKKSFSFDPACSGYPTAVICASDPSCTWNGSECDKKSSSFDPAC